MTKPPYIEYGNDPSMHLPASANGTTLYCFIVRGTYQNILNLCNQRLNIAPTEQPKQYFPMGNQVMFAFSQIPAGKMLDTQYQHRGLVEEVALQIFVPVVECIRNERGEWVAQEIVIFCPYIAVDNLYSLVTGREVVGFPKTLAQFQLPTSPQYAPLFKTNVYAIKDYKTSPNMSFFPWVSVVQTPHTLAFENESSSIYTDFTKIVHGAKQFLDVDTALFQGKLPFIYMGIQNWYFQQFSMVFLKQFRDVADTTKACYQAVTKAPSVMKKLNQGWVLKGNYMLHIDTIQSLPIEHDLGLPLVQPVNFAFWLNLDLEFLAGEEVWRTV